MLMNKVLIAGRQQQPSTWIKLSQTTALSSSTSSSPAACCHQMTASSRSPPLVFSMLQRMGFAKNSALRGGTQSQMMLERNKSRF